MDRKDRPSTGPLARVLEEIRHHIRVFISAAEGSFAFFLAEYPPAVFVALRVPRFIFQAAFFVLLARVAGGPELARYALLGNAIQVAINMGLVGMTSTVESEKWIGTLPILIAVPSHKLPALMGRGVANLIDGWLGIIIALGFGMLIFRTGFPALGLLRAAPLILLVSFTVLAMGMLLGSALLPTRVGTLSSNLLSYVMMVICGVNFPVSLLPEWLGILARFLPVTSGLEAIRAVVDGARYGDVAGLIALEVGVGLAYLILGTLIFDARLRAARQKGALELF
jgi:ABC-2 type transport system permease protein